jgi:uncharacterized protein (DUF1697 family)
MPRFIAFLRAINVGGRRVSMDALRSHLESMGFANVETFIASGNVIFESSARNVKGLEKKIEDGLREALGYEVATFIRSVDELAAIVAHKPFDEVPDTGGLYIAFIPDAPDTAVQNKLLSFRNDIDDFHIHNREIYWLCRTRSSDSTFSGSLLEKTLKMPATIRNATTVRKMAEKYGSR